MWVIILENANPEYTMLFGPYEFEEQAKHDLENAALIEMILSDTSGPDDSIWLEASMFYMNPVSKAQEEGYIGGEQASGSRERNRKA